MQRRWPRRPRLRRRPATRPPGQPAGWSPRGPAGRVTRGRDRGGAHRPLRGTPAAPPPCSSATLGRPAAAWLA